MNNPYEELANAIIIQAVKDYRSALKHLKRCPSSKPARDEAAELERFFSSDWCKQLTAVDGEYLISQIRKECAV